MTPYVKKLKLAGKTSPLPKEAANLKVDINLNKDSSEVVGCKEVVETTLNEMYNSAGTLGAANSSRHLPSESPTTVVNSLRPLSGSNYDHPKRMAGLMQLTFDQRSIDKGEDLELV